MQLSYAASGVVAHLMLQCLLFLDPNSFQVGSTLKAPCQPHPPGSQVCQDIFLCPLLSSEVETHGWFLCKGRKTLKDAALRSLRCTPPYPVCKSLHHMQSTSQYTDDFTITQSRFPPLGAEGCWPPARGWVRPSQKRHLLLSHCSFLSPDL